MLSILIEVSNLWFYLWPSNCIPWNIFTYVFKFRLIARLIVQSLHSNLIESVVIFGTHVGNNVHIPRLNLMSSDETMPIKFQRRQYPLTLSFAMTINNSQGQTLSNVRIYLLNPVFSYDQLYVAISRVKSRPGLKILVCNDDCSHQNHKKYCVKRGFPKDIYVINLS